MKKLKNFFLISFFLFLTLASYAPPPNPPADAGTGGGGGGPVGAPIDGGLGMLVILAGSAAYGGVKLYKARKDKEEQETDS